MYIELICKKARLSKPMKHEISQIAPEYRYVDGIPTLTKLQIS